MNKDKRYFINTLLILTVLLVLLGGITVVIDPLFHYHRPLEQIQYPIKNERYQNDGITKNFDYSAIITGTSMTENFKTSEAQQLFHESFIKIPFSGARYKEISEALGRALKANSDVSIIIWGLDADALLADKDDARYDSYPTYLYDNNLFNDVQYVLNKEILFNYSIAAWRYTKTGGKTTTFDKYASWSHEYEYGKEAVESSYSRPIKNAEIKEWTVDYMQMLEENLSQNVLALIEENPDVIFYLFMPPYSIYTWDRWNQYGEVSIQLEAQKRAIELLVEYDNVRLFSFFDNFEMICDLDNYKDAGHYSEDINSRILNWMANDEYRLTKENYQDYCERVEEFYMSYDYDSMFE